MVEVKSFNPAKKYRRRKNNENHHSKATICQKGVFTSKRQSACRSYVLGLTFFAFQEKIYISA